MRSFCLPHHKHHRAADSGPGWDPNPPRARSNLCPPADPWRPVSPQPWQFSGLNLCVGGQYWTRPGSCPWTTGERTSTATPPPPPTTHHPIPPPFYTTMSLPIISQNFKFWFFLHYFNFQILDFQILDFKIIIFSYLRFIFSDLFYILMNPFTWNIS